MLSCMASCRPTPSFWRLALHMAAVKRLVHCQWQQLLLLLLLLLLLHTAELALLFKTRIVLTTSLIYLLRPDCRSGRGRWMCGACKV
jgi:hypothetical protein